MRRPAVLPMAVVSEDEASDAASSMSDEPPPKQPQHHLTNYRMKQRAIGGTRSKIAQHKLPRSSRLQSTMDRIQQRNHPQVGAESPAPRHDEQDDQNNRDDDSEQVGQVLEMFSTYDALLDHLIRKNRDLKKYVRHESDYFPSSGSYTTMEVVDTLEALRRERDNNPLKHISGRKSTSQPRPTKVGDPNTWQETYPQPDYFGRPIGKKNDRGNTIRQEHRGRKLGTLKGGHVPPEIKVGEESRRQRHKGTSESRLQTQHMLNVMKEYKNDMRESTDTRRKNEEAYAGNAQQLHGRRYGAGERARIRDRRSSPASIREGTNRTLQGRKGLDPIELLRAKNDREWLQGYSPRGDGNDPNERDSAPGSDFTGSHTASAMLSRLLPEKIPPKIKASRDRLAQFRNSRLRAKSVNLRYDDDANAEPRPLRASTQIKMTSTRYEQRSPARSRYTSPRSVRPGSPDRPLNVEEYEFDQQRRRIGSEQDEYYQNPQSRFFGQSRHIGPNYLRPGSPGRPLNVEESENYDQRRRIGNNREEYYRVPQQSRFTGHKPASTRDERWASRTRRYGDNQSHLHSAHQTHEYVSEYSGEQDMGYSSQDDSSVTPTEKVRRLRTQVDDLVLSSKELGASQEQMKDELVGIKQLFHTRNESRNDRALRMRQPTPKEETYTDQGGRVHLVSHSIQPRNTSSRTRNGHVQRNEDRKVHYSTYGVIRPPHHSLASPPVDGESPKQTTSKRNHKIWKRVGAQLSPRFTEFPETPGNLFKDAAAQQIRGYQDDKNHVVSASGTSENEEGHLCRERAFEKSLLSSSSDDNSQKLTRLKDGEDDHADLQILKAKQALYMDPILTPAQHEQRGCCM